VRFAVALVASLPAALLRRHPVIATAAVRSPSQLGARAGALYAVNTLGAALGTALAGFWLPGLVGVNATYGFAIACLAVAGGGAVLLSRSVAEIPEPVAAPIPEASAPAPRATPKSRAIKHEEAGGRRAAAPITPARPALRPVERELGRRGLVAIAITSGFGAFALQVLLVQSFAQVLNQSIYAFGAVLVVVLLAIAAAGALVAALQSRAGLDPRTLLGLALVAAALALAAFPAALARATHDFEYVGGDGGGLADLAAALGVVVCGRSAILAVDRVPRPPSPRRSQRGDAMLRARTARRREHAGRSRRDHAPYLLMPTSACGRRSRCSRSATAPPVFVRANLAAPRRDLMLAIGWLIVVFRANRSRALSISRRARDDARGIVAVVGMMVPIHPDNHYALGDRGRVLRQQVHLPLLLRRARAIAPISSATGIARAARSHTRSSRCTSSRSCRASRARPSTSSPTPTAASTAIRAPMSSSTMHATSCAPRASASTSSSPTSSSPGNRAPARSTRASTSKPCARASIPAASSANGCRSTNSRRRSSRPTASRLQPALLRRFPNAIAAKFGAEGSDDSGDRGSRTGSRRGRQTAGCGSRGCGRSTSARSPLSRRQAPIRCTDDRPVVGFPPAT
jgi:MFS family permease